MQFVNEGVYEGIVTRRQPRKQATGIDSIEVGQKIGEAAVPFYFPRAELFALVPQEGEAVRVTYAIKHKAKVGQHNNVTSAVSVTVVRVEPMVKAGGPLPASEDPFKGKTPAASAKF